MAEVTFIGGQRLFGNLNIGSFVGSGDFLNQTDKICSGTIVLSTSPSLMARYTNIEVQKYIDRLIVRLENLFFNRIVFLSTAGVYGFSRSHRSFSEDDPVNPRTVYAKEKLLLEEALQSLCKTRGAYFINLRIAGLYTLEHFDRRDTNLLDQIAATFSCGSSRSWEIEHGGKQLRDFCSVDFLRKVVIEVIYSKIEHSIYLNVSDTVPLVLKDLLHALSHYNSNLQFNFLHSDETCIHNSLKTSRLGEILSGFENSKKTLRELLMDITD